MNFRRINAEIITISFDETTTRSDVEQLWAVIAGSRAPFTVTELDADAMPKSLPVGLVRSSVFRDRVVRPPQQSRTTRV